MKIKKSISFFLSAFFIANYSAAQDSATTTVEDSELENQEISLLSSWNTRNSFGAQMVTWIEPLRLQQGADVTYDNANFYGTAVGVDREYTKGRWGFGPTLALMFGRANGGGNNSLSYASGRLGWSGGIVGLRSYYRLSNMIAAGVQLPVVVRSVSWPSTSGIEATSGKNINYSLLLEFKIRFNRDWEMSQAIGPFSSNGGSLWRAGVSKTW